MPTSAPVITVEPATNDTLLTGATLNTTLANIGTPPFTYFWFTNGSTTPIKHFVHACIDCSQLESGRFGTNYCIVSNHYGTDLSSNLVLDVVAPNPYEQVMLELNPIALWPLDEA